jgi:hypothetical protein
VVTYARSWDIVKFLGVGAFFANILFADLLARWPRRGRAPMIAGLVALTTLSSWILLLRVGALDGRLGVPRMHFPGPSEAGRLLAERIEPHLAPGDQVFSTNTDLGTAGGLLTPGFDWNQVGQGFLLDRPRAERLNALKTQARRDLDPAALRGLDVQWLVLSPGDEAALSPAGRAALRDPARFERVEVLEAGRDRRTLYRVLPPRP